MGPETALSYMVRYKGDEWIGNLQLLMQGGLLGNFRRRSTHKVEMGADVDLHSAGF